MFDIADGRKNNSAHSTIDMMQDDIHGYLRHMQDHIKLSEYAIEQPAMHVMVFWIYSTSINVVG